MKMISIRFSNIAEGERFSWRGMWMVRVRPIFLSTNKWANAVREDGLGFSQFHDDSIVRNYEHGCSITQIGYGCLFYCNGQRYLRTMMFTQIDGQRFNSYNENGEPCFIKKDWLCSVERLKN